MNAYCKYDIRGFSEELGIPMEDIEALYREFVSEIHSEVIRLKELLSLKDWENIKKCIHNIKGISVNYRIIDLHEQAVVLYNALKAENYNGIEPIFEHFFDISESSEKEITAYFKQ